MQCWLRGSVAERQPCARQSMHLAHRRRTISRVGRTRVMCKAALLGGLISALLGTGAPAVVLGVLNAVEQHHSWLVLFYVAIFWLGGLFNRTGGVCSRCNRRTIAPLLRKPRGHVACSGTACSGPWISFRGLCRDCVFNPISGHTFADYLALGRGWCPFRRRLRGFGSLGT